MSNEVAQQPEVQLSELFIKFGEKYHINPATVPTLLERTAFKQENNQSINKPDMIALLVVAMAYDLNPFTREIYAFPAKNGRVVPVVGVDGWARIINGNPQFDGMDFGYSEKLSKRNTSQLCHEWVECRIYRKDRQHPVVVREYLDECYRQTAQWNDKTKRLLRHRSVIQCARYAFGLTGIYDAEEAESISVSDALRPADGVEGPLTGGLAKAKAMLDDVVKQAVETGSVESGAQQVVAAEQASEPLFAE